MYDVFWTADVKNTLLSILNTKNNTVFTDKLNNVYIDRWRFYMDESNTNKYA